MRCSFVNPIMRWAAMLCVVAMAAKAEAVTKTFNEGVLRDGQNNPLFADGGPAGFSGTATDKVDSISVVSGIGIEQAGSSSSADLSDNNGLPIGVRFTFDLNFTVQSTSPNSTLSAGGNNTNGLAVATTGEGGTQQNRINPGEQLLFTDFTISNVSVIDPLGLIQPGTVSAANPLWRALRSSNFISGVIVTTSSDAEGTENTTTYGFGQEKNIGDNLTTGTLNEPLPSVYITTSGSGQWQLRAIGYQADLSFELAPTQPAERRTFKFFDLTGAYDNQPTHGITDRDTIVSIAAIAPEPPEGGQPTVLDTNTTGVGVLSASDPTGNESGARRIDGNRDEAIHFSFSRDVSLESITLGNFNWNPAGGETMVLSFVSGDVNPFEGLTGYSGDYLVTDRLFYTMSEPKAESGPFLIPFGMGEQGQIIVQAGTVLALSSANALQNGILLNMITANLLEIPALEGDHNGDGTVDAADYVLWRKDPAAHGGDPDGYNTWQANFGSSLAGSGGENSLGAVPEPAVATLLILAVACYPFLRRREA